MGKSLIAIVGATVVLIGVGGYCIYQKLTANETSEPVTKVEKTDKPENDTTD